jgi:hypothetical protein
VSEKLLPHRPRKTPINTARIAAPLFIARPFRLSAGNEDFRIIHHTLTYSAEFRTATRQGLMPDSETGHGFALGGGPALPSPRPEPAPAAVPDSAND